MEKKNVALGVISFIFGLLSILTICLGIEIFPAIVSFVIGIIAIVKQNCKKGLAITGVVLSSIAIIAFFFTILGYVQDAHEKNVQKVQTEQSTAQSEQSTEQTKNAEEKGDGPFKVGDTVETEDLRIKFLKAEPYTEEYDSPSKGNEFYKFEFEFENISDSNQYISSFDFHCYADGYDVESAYSSKDKDLDATLSAGKKTKGVVCFEIPKDTKEISLEYETNFWSESKVCFEVDK